MGDLQQVLRVLADDATYPAKHPAETRAMVTKGLSTALPQIGQEQHQIHKDRVETATSILAEALRVSIDAALDAKTLIREGEDQLVSCKAAVESAMSTTMLARDNCQQKTAAHDAKKKEVSTLEKEFQMAEKVKAGVSQKADMTRFWKAKSDAVVKALQDIDDGTALPTERTTEMVSEYLQAAGAEKALIAAVPGALKYPPSERRGFDVVAIKAINVAVSRGEKPLIADLAAVVQEETYAEAEAYGAWAIADVERDRMATIAKAVKDSKWILQQAEEAERDGLDAASKQGGLIGNAHAFKKSAEEKVGDLQQAMEALQRLKEKQWRGHVAAEALESVVEEKNGPSKADLRKFVASFVNSADLEKQTLGELKKAMVEKFGELRPKHLHRAKRMAMKVMLAGSQTGISGGPGGRRDTGTDGDDKVDALDEAPESPDRDDQEQQEPKDMDTPLKRIAMNAVVASPQPEVHCEREVGESNDVHAIGNEGVKRKRDNVDEVAESTEGQTPNAMGVVDIIEKKSRPEEQRERQNVGETADIEIIAKDSSNERVAMDGVAKALGA